VHELFAEIDRWRNAGKTVALATVVKVYGSAPRPLGAKLAVSSAGEMAGSVSGGCVEGAVVQEALAVLAEGRPRLLEYGIADELAMSVGLACGGSIEVWVEALPPSGPWLGFEAAMRAARLVAMATVLSGPAAGQKVLLFPDGRSEGDTGLPQIEAAVRERIAERFATGTTEKMSVEVAGAPVAVLVDVVPPPPKLVIIGAVHIAMPLVVFGNALGWHTVVIDARSAFATHERLGHAHQLLVGWPADLLPGVGVDEATYAVVLTHDEKIDDPALAWLIRSPARYVGALGSRKTHAKRVERLREAGLSDGELARIHAPIGLAIGARRPEEIAVAIAAEIVAVINGAQ
jgi:xanthine dehydrogenase accessory factor